MPPPAGEAAIVRDGAACVDAAGVAVTDPECVCGDPTCVGCACCASLPGLACSFPGQTPASPVSPTFHVHQRLEYGFQFSPPETYEGSVDRVVQLGCYPDAGGVVPNIGSRWRWGALSYPSRIQLVIGSLTIDWSPTGVVWAASRALSAAPSGMLPGRYGPTTWNATVTAGPCARMAHAEYEETGYNFNLLHQAVERVTTSIEWDFSVEDPSPLPCPSAADAPDAPCEGCLEGFAPRPRNSDAGSGA